MREEGDLAGEPLSPACFTRPRTVAQRDSEILRARVLEGLSLRQLADRFEVGRKYLRSFLRRATAQDVRRFFAAGPRAGSSRADGDVLREMVVEWRKQNYSVGDDERPAWCKPEAAAYADVRALSLESGRSLSSRWGGVLLFLPFLGELRLDRLIQRAGYPGTRMIPGWRSWRA